MFDKELSMYRKTVTDIRIKIIDILNSKDESDLGLSDDFVKLVDSLAITSRDVGRLIEKIETKSIYREAINDLDYFKDFVKELYVTSSGISEKFDEMTEAYNSIVDLKLLVHFDSEALPLILLCNFFLYEEIKLTTDFMRILDNMIAKIKTVDERIR